MSAATHRAFKSSRPAQPPLHQLLSTPAPPSHHRPQAFTHCLISSCPLFCPGAACTEQNPSPKGTHPRARPTHPSARTPRPPIPRQALTHIVILEGMEKVASQLPVVSWSARGIANATYVVWRILWETRGQVVSRTVPWGRTQPYPPQSHSPCPHPSGSQQHTGLRKAHTPILQPTPLTFGSPSMSPDPAERGEKG